mmetsp:Transcript_7044/g.11699  ORF Transcript_7044/g.11699 Transcript_7044/m.11699 type:complete len:129 (+) Transcript_7044:872-1258(+)
MLRMLKILLPLDQATTVRHLSSLQSSNGKVLKCIATDRASADFSKRVFLPPGPDRSSSPAVVLVGDRTVAKLVYYDIKYGAPEKLEDILLVSSTVCAYVEDVVAKGMAGPSRHSWVPNRFGRYTPVSI